MNCHLPINHRLTILYSNNFSTDIINATLPDGPVNVSDLSIPFIPIPKDESMDDDQDDEDKIPIVRPKTVKKTDLQGQLIKLFTMKASEYSIPNFNDIFAKNSLAMASGTTVTALGWKTLGSMLAKFGIRLGGWPFNADTPPKRDLQKGIAGLPNTLLQMLVDVMKRTDNNTLKFIKLSDRDKDRKSSLIYNLFCLF
jgi:hypothetical protein